MFFTNSIIKRYFIFCIGSGIMMGLIFPPFASLFTTYKKESFFLPFTALCVVAGIIVGIMSYFIGKFTLIRSIRNIIHHFETISKGDLTKRMDIKSTDEIGEMSKRFNDFVEKLETLVLEMYSMSNSLTQFSANLYSEIKFILNVGEEKNSTNTLDIENLKNNTFNTANSIKFQSQEIKKASEAINNITQSTYKIDSLAENTMELYKLTSVEANAGWEAVEKNMEMMQRTNNTVKDIEKKVAKLGESSSEIGKIVDVITAISEQTNLLALNAAIEAARAGEAGKGFAVVSDEIRKLADMSRRSAVDIMQKVDDIQQEIDLVNDIAKAGYEEVELGTNLSAELKEKLKNVIENIKSTYIEVKNISTSIKEQVDSMTQIRSNAENIVSQSINVEELSQSQISSLDTISDKLYKVLNTSEELSNRVVNLSELLEQFKTSKS